MSSKATPAVEQTMSFLDHLDELRRRLMYSAFAIAIAFCVCFYFSERIYGFLVKPLTVALQEARTLQLERSQKPIRAIDELADNTNFTYVFNNEANLQGVMIPAGTTIPAKLIRNAQQKRVVVAANSLVVGRSVLPEGFEIPTDEIGEYNNTVDSPVVHTLQGGFNLYVKVAFYAALALSVPFLIWQLWLFIEPGLYEQEKRSVVPFVTLATVFFLLGSAFAYYVAFPNAIRFFLTVSKNFRPMIEVNEYFDLVITIILGLGLVFEIPTIVYFFARFGLITPKFMLKFWRHATVVIVILAAVISPTTDIPNMLVFAVPMEALYFLSVGIAWFVGRQRQKAASELAS